MDASSHDYDDWVSRWGVPHHRIEMRDEARKYLLEKVGPADPQPPVVRADIRVGNSRLGAEDVAALIRVLGEAGVRVDDDSRLRYSGGFSYLDLVERRTHPDHLPDAVLSPSAHDEVLELLGVCQERDIAIVPFGGGTSVVGGVRPVRGTHGAVVAVAFDRMCSVISVDEENLSVRVQPGITGPELERELAGHNLTMGHFPQSWERASLGGYAATRSSGQASAGYGRSNDMIESLKVATLRGTFDLGVAPGTAAGPDLRQVFIGSEGAFGIITELTVRVRPRPAMTRYEGIMFPDYETGLRAMRGLVARRAKADVMRLSDEHETATNLTMAVSGAKGQALGAYLRLRGVSGGALGILSWEGTRTQLGSRRDEAWRVLRQHRAVSLGSTVGDGWAKSRFSGPYLRDTLMDEGYLVETLETSTWWSELPALRRAIGAALHHSLADSGPGPLIMSHLSHVYDTGGSLYVTVIARRDSTDSVRQWQSAKEAACQAIVDHHATITHHHAVGRDHAPWLHAEVGVSGIELLRGLKQHFDPQGILNPGVLVGDAREA